MGQINQRIALRFYLLTLLLILGTAPLTPAQDVFFTQDDSTVTIATSDTLGSVFMLFSGAIDPTLIPMQMDMSFTVIEDTTRVLIFSLEDSSFTEGPVIAYTGSGRLDSVEAADFNGTPLTTAINVVVDIEDRTGPTLPGSIELLPNYPNPFNPETVIEFTLPRGSAVTVDVFNMTGQRVRRLVNQALPAGRFRVVWDGHDNAGAPVASGVYFYRLTTGDEQLSRKMLLLR